MKILLLGKNGQVGWELQRALQPLGEVVSLSRKVDDLIGLSGDVADFQKIADAFRVVSPDVVVNATAYTAVDKAEEQKDEADLINHLAVKNLAELCKNANALLVHYSTDYVFDGQGVTPWREDDKTSPINTYGASKRAGEEALEQSGVQFLNFRTCWVYAARGHNFIKTMINLAKSREELNIISDQIGVPTGAALIADVTAHAIRYYSANKVEQVDLHGHYHLAPNGETSWFDYANFIFTQVREKGLELKLKQVKPIATTAYPTPAQRPLNSRLDTNKLQTKFKLHLPDWQQGVEHVLEEIIE